MIDEAEIWRRKFNALKMGYDAQEKMLSHYHTEYNKYFESIQTLDSERAVNEQLTKEIDELKLEITRLRDIIQSSGVMTDE